MVTSSSTSATSSNSTTATLLSSLGAGSGINMAALAEQLSTAQFSSRIDQLTNKNDKLTTQISAASTLKSMASAIASSLGDRVRTGDLAVAPVIANGTVATVSKGTATGSGTSTLEVTSLAKGETLVSPSVTPATSPVGSGTLTLRFGTMTTDATGTSFTADTTRAQVNVTIAAGATLDDVALAINGTGSGVTAYVATNAAGAQLVLKGKDGAANAFTLEAAEDPADPGLSSLAWAPANGTARLKSAASDAAYTLDGVSRTSASNTITDAAPGLSLKLTATNIGAPTTISFSDPTSAITTAMQDLTSALNEMVSELNKDTDPTSGTLNNDPGARTMRRLLAQLAGSTVMPSAAAGAPATMADLGLKTNRDGTYTLDTARLSATLTRDPSGSAAMFTSGLFGVYATVDKFARSVTTSTDPSSLGGSITRMTKLQTTISTQKSDLATKQETLRGSLVSRFASLDGQLSAQKSTLSFLQAQVAAWNSKTG